MWGLIVCSSEKVCGLTDYSLEKVWSLVVYSSEKVCGLINTLLRKQGTSRAELLDALGIKSGNTLTTHINTIKTKMKIIEIREGKFIKYKLELQ